MKKIVSSMFALLTVVVSSVSAFAAQPPVMAEAVEPISVVEGFAIDENDVLIDEFEGTAVYYNAPAASYKVVWAAYTPAYASATKSDSNWIGDTSKQVTATLSSLTGWCKVTSFTINGQVPYLYGGDRSSYTTV